MLWNILDIVSNKDEILNKLLDIRNISEEEKSAFLNPPLSDTLLEKFHEEMFTELEKAKNIIEYFIKNNFPIIIHGDYDADGICATAILFETIKKGLSYDKVLGFIPNRFKHSYGITKASIDECKKRIIEEFGTHPEYLLISVDTGITAVEEVLYAKEQDFKVIITDHHQKPVNLPEADEIVWSDLLVGSGVSWILCTYLGYYSDNLKSLVSIATVTDLQPLLGLNRSIVKEGLHILNSTPIPGIKALLDVAERSNTSISTYDLGWVIGPRINASGRIGDASLALDLLQSDSYEDAHLLAEQLNKVNMDRQDKTSEMYGMVEITDTENLPKVMLTSSEKYHEGIIGLVAARIVQDTNRPAIVVSINGDVGKGSVRSVRGLDIISFLRKFEDLFDSLGGHPMAAGFTIKVQNIKSLEEALLKEAENINDELLQPTLTVDLEINSSLLQLPLLFDIERMQPFGIGNTTPVFVSRRLGVVNLTKVGKNKTHLSIKLIKDNKYYKGILFNNAENFDFLKIGDLVDIAYTIERNEYNGNVYLNLVLKDIRLSD